MKTKLALCLIVKGDPQEAVALSKCLDEMPEAVDGIFVTITHRKGEARSPEVEMVCSQYGAVISDFEWVNDFSKARNFNFAQVPIEYTHILWCDADDGIRGAKELKSIIEQHPDVDAFVMDYLYAFNEHHDPIVVHQKAQIVKNDGCVTWVGALHEDFKQNRLMSTFRIEGVERVHMTDDLRIEGNKRRNYKIAQAMAKESPDDARSHFNLGNAAYAVGSKFTSLEAFDRFLEMSQSDDEKYIARIRKAEIYMSMDKKEDAINEAQRAIGLKPMFPDAYHMLGVLFFESKRYLEAADMLKEGLKKKPPVLDIIVYNPRDYDYVPLMNLAKCYYALNLPDLALAALEGCQSIYPRDKTVRVLIEDLKPAALKFAKVIEVIAPLKEMSDDLQLNPKQKTAAQLSKVRAKLSKAMAALSEDVVDHPAICNIRNLNFIKEKSSGKDLAIYCGYTDEAWNPDSVKAKGIGGSEEAVIWLSKLLTLRGWHVEVYNNSGLHHDAVYSGVTYKPFWTWNYRDKQDAVVLWRQAKPLDYDINAPKVYVDMHDVMPEGEFSPARVEKITKILVKSKFQRSLLPKVPDGKFEVIPNGIDPSAFELFSGIERDPNLIIATSSANRFLSAMLDLLPEIQKEVPEAHVKWAYGWSTIKDRVKENDKIIGWVESMEEKIKQTKGFEDLGRLSHEEVAKLYLSANVFGYPTGFAEIHCISAAKAQAAGAIPVTTDFSALEETVQYGTKVHSRLDSTTWQNDEFDFAMKDPEEKKAWVAAVVNLLKNPPTEEERMAMRVWAMETYSWSGIADRWHGVLSEKIKQ